MGILLSPLLKTEITPSAFSQISLQAAFITAAASSSSSLPRQLPVTICASV